MIIARSGLDYKSSEKNAVNGNAGNEVGANTSSDGGVGEVGSGGCGGANACGVEGAASAARADRAACIGAACWATAGATPAPEKKSACESFGDSSHEVKGYI